MPVVTLSVSESVAREQKLLNGLLKEINRTVSDHLSVSIAKMKSSVVVVNDLIIGDGSIAHGCAHLRLECYRGRPTELLHDLIGRLAALLKTRLAAIPGKISLAVYLQEIDPQTSSFEVIG